MIIRLNRVRLAVAFLAAGLGLITELAAAAPAEPEKCTCDAVRETNHNNGAQVLNATACWSSQYDDLQWCDITVQSLEGDAGAHAALVATLFSYDSGNDPAELVNLLFEQFEAFVSTYQEGLRDVVAFSVDQARDIVPHLLKENEKALEECVVAFEDATSGNVGFPGVNSEDFRCRVGQSSGWLRIEFRVGDVWLAYMLAPNG